MFVGINFALAALVVHYVVALVGLLLSVQLERGTMLEFTIVIFVGVCR